ncbi:sensor domain-containing protein [Sciscionella sediminilitoris]|uniref:sensor domain-containing protein n=1 Tax=Sciscionella sediminilitoris TaxID=1445613 RepID=UPI0018D00C5C|nr:sensor domain-containing protein [Sciscionella sp. SE31]
MNHYGSRIGETTVHALLGLLTGLASLVFLPVLLVCALTCLLGIGLVLLPAALRFLRVWACWHERRAAGLLGQDSTSRPQQAGSGWAVLRRQLADPATRRELGWLCTHAIAGVLTGIVALAGAGVSIGTVLAAAFWWTPPLAGEVQFLGVAVTDWPGALEWGAIQLVLAAAVWILVVPPLTLLGARIGRAVLNPPVVRGRPVEPVSSGAGRTVDG